VAWLDSLGRAGSGARKNVQQAVGGTRVDAETTGATSRPRKSRHGGKSCRNGPCNERDLRSRIVETEAVMYVLLGGSFLPCVPMDATGICGVSTFKVHT
jgi:hypothetical protein